MVKPSYQDLFSSAKKAYPERSGQNLQKWVNRHWVSVKNDEVKYSQLMREIRFKCESAAKKQEKLQNKFNYPRAKKRRIEPAEPQVKVEKPVGKPKREIKIEKSDVPARAIRKKTCLGHFRV